MTIKFFIVAFVWYSLSEAPEVKLHKGFVFETYSECTDTLVTFQQGFKESLERKFPYGKKYSMTCLDTKTLLDIKEKHGYEFELNT